MAKLDTLKVLLYRLHCNGGLVDIFEKHRANFWKDGQLTITIYAYLDSTRQINKNNFKSLAQNLQRNKKCQLSGVQDGDANDRSRETWRVSHTIYTN